MIPPSCHPVKRAQFLVGFSQSRNQRRLGPCLRAFFKARRADLQFLGGMCLHQFRYRGAVTRLQFHQFRLKARSFRLRLIDPLLKACISIPALSFLLFAFALIGNAVVISSSLRQVEKRLDLFEARFAHVLADCEGGARDGNEAEGEHGGMDVHSSVNPISKKDSSTESHR
jgi:hypothetical protein